MTFLQAFILGLAQGLTEFLPVSSSGHLVMLQAIFNIQQPGLWLEILLHVGTLGAVLVAMRRDVAAIFKNFFGRLTGLLVVATIPAVVFSLLFDSFIDSIYGGKYLTLGFLFTAGVLFFSDRLPTGKKKLSTMTVWDALLIGLAQCVAIVPAISRSGSTIVAGLACGLKREDATRFSFLMSIPAILGALVFQLKDALMGGSTPEMDWGTLLVAMLVAAVVGFFAIRALTLVVKKRKMAFFGWYVLVLGIFVLVDQLFLHRFFLPLM